MHNLPINGRIAIIDDEEKEAMPLMRVFSKHQIPYVFYKGNDLRFLPEENARYNDIRVLFLDINLLNTASPSASNVKSILLGVLKRVISVDNFPYSLIYWSKQESEYATIVQDLFRNELKDRAPINFISFLKSDFFPNFGDEEKSNEIDLLEEIGKIIDKEPAYSYLLNWENQVHNSADLTLQEVFSSYHKFENWANNANYLINKLGVSYSGKRFKSQTPLERLRGSFNALNMVFNDTLEHSINTTEIIDAKELESSEKNQVESIYSINKKLLFSSDLEPINYSGAILEDSDSKNDAIFSDLLHKSFNRKSVESQIGDKQGKTEAEIERLVKKEVSAIKKRICQKWKKIYFVTTPLCDYVQGKLEHNRVVKGIMIKKDEKIFIDDKSEAVFISPAFSFEKENYVIVLNFRYFFTVDQVLQKELLKPLFRARQQLLAEVQSKLARHISRQGILFLDER